MRYDEQYLEIPLNKTKMVFLFIGALLFVASGIWFLINPEKLANQGHRHWPVEMIITVGWAAILFFGVCGVFIFKKLWDSKPGLIINGAGFIDNSSAISAGIILWKDIVEISTTQIVRQRLIMVHLKNPQEYIAHQPNKLKRKLMAINQKNYGTPVQITSNALKISFNELYFTIKNYWEVSKSVK